MRAYIWDRLDFQGARGDTYGYQGQSKYTHRPIFVKFKICAGDECEDCPSDTECGWNRTPVYNHLDTVSDKVHVAEFWADCI